MYSRRMSSNREFFRCELSKIKTTIDNISDLFKKKTIGEIYKKYTYLMKSYLKSFGFDYGVIDSELQQIEKKLEINTLMYLWMISFIIT